MAEQVIIEFVGDTTKLEDAYNKVSAQVTESGNLNKESAAAFQKANADIASSFEHATDASKKFNEQLRNLGAVVAGGVLKDIISQLKAIDKAQGDIAGSTKEIGSQITTLKTFAEVGRSISASFSLASDTLALFGKKNEDLEKAIAKVQAAMKVVNGLIEVQSQLSKDSALATALQETNTKALTAAKWLEVEATAAEKAAAAGWVGLAIAGIVAIGAAIYNLIGREKEHEEQQRKVKDAIDAENIELEHQTKIYQELGLSVTELEKLKENNAIKKIDNDIKELYKTVEEGSAFSLKNGLYMMISGGGTLDYPKEFKDKLAELENIKKEHLNNIDGLNKKDDNEEAAQKQMHNDLMYDIHLKGYAKLRQAFLEQREERMTQFKSAADQELFQKRTHELVRIMDTQHNLEEQKKQDEASLLATREHSQAELDIKKKLAEDEKKLITNDPSKSAGDIALAEAQYTAAINKLDADFKAYWAKESVELDKRTTNHLESTSTKDDDTPQKLPDAGLASQTAEEDAKKKKRIATEKEVATASINFAKQASDQIFAVTNQNRNNRYNAEISTLQKQAAFELNNNNLTQAQKLAIQRKFQKEEAAVKLQQFKADQKAKEEQAAINGALAIVTLTASTPPMIGLAPNPAYFIGLASVIATTATSVATIAAQKPPQFAKGTPKGTPVTPAGTKLVGEHGPELIYTPGGERIITAPDTAAILAKYDVPALPNVSPAIAMRANLNHTHPLLNEDTLAQKIAAAISKQTKPHLTFDKNGFTAHLINRGSKTTILNNKYKL